MLRSISGRFTDGKITSSRRMNFILSDSLAIPSFQTTVETRCSHSTLVHETALAESKRIRTFRSLITADCGNSLAYSEMRLILARTVYNFDMRLDESSVHWINQKNFLMWQKGPLRVHLTQATREKDKN